jgi:hypothetical protein
VRAISMHAAAATIMLALGASTPRSQQAASVLTTQQSPEPTLKYSKVRSARLSEVKGDVALDRNAGAGFEIAFANLPITEGSRLQTGMGRVEVEFEDNSTVRLAPFTLVEFSRLQLLPSGAKASTVTVLKGTAYVSLIPSYVVNTKGNDFLLSFGEQTLHLEPSAHIRLQLGETEAQLAVLDGAGHLEAPVGGARLTRKKTFTFNLMSPAGPAIARHVRKAPLDKWDRSSADVHIHNASIGSLPNLGGKGSKRPASSGMPHDIFR